MADSLESVQTIWYTILKFFCSVRKEVVITCIPDQDIEMFVTVKIESSVPC